MATKTVVKAVMLLAAASVGGEVLAAWDQPFLQTISSSDSLRAAQESFDSVQLVLWAVKAASVVAATFLLMFTAKRLHADDYESALWSFMGAVVAGCSPFLAQALLFT